MNDGDAAKKLGSPVVLVSATSATVNGINSGGGGLFSKTRYKFWAITAILLLALWSMFTGSVTLRWSGAGNISNPLSDSFDSPVRDLDILEVEEREKLVRRFWNIYTHSRTTRLPSFWQEAFEAAYEHLTSDVAGSRNAAISEIAKMSLVSVDVEPLPLNSGFGGSRKSMRQGVVRKNTA
ncbi:uncharacterized protein LOC111894843 [Lactuca sativa]|uniref:Uncharacterized protein n=1 Tax=Lactuca sativa TaxID=4236 RepID=A0A9R1VIX7_LACSA|nr:uncharacterized protein LOC111894843 [Lactuca sativa]KAJ0205523.1 hypothetical protein LSAT_V11C500239000 [Lactuca sativa]